MDLRFVPMKDFSARYAEGWRLAQKLDPNDYAALMRPPSAVPAQANKSKAAISRNAIRYGRVAAADTTDEVDRLRDQVARLTGSEQVEHAMRAFSIDRRKAMITMLLIKRGLVGNDAIADMIYSDDERVEIGYIEGAVRDHIKRLRPALAKHGISFATSYGYGYEMSDAMRERAKSLMQQYA